jgi:hypothetical protein
MAGGQQAGGGEAQDHGGGMSGHHAAEMDRNSQ